MQSLTRGCASGSAASACSTSAPAAAARCLLPAAARHRCPPPPRAAGSGTPQHPEENERPGGDSGLQDSLIKQLQFEIGKKRVDEFVAEEAEGLKAKAEEAKEELEKLADLQNLKAEVAFNSALADINREADEFEEQLRRSREQQKAAEAELEQWEDDVAVARSEGQFFKSLYQPKGKARRGGAAAGADLATAEEVQARRERVTEPARTELSSRVRYYLFAFLAFVLAGEVIADLQSDAPSAVQDVIYTLLVVALGVTSLSERRTKL